MEIARITNRRESRRTHGQDHVEQASSAPSPPSLPPRRPVRTCGSAHDPLETRPQRTRQIPLPLLLQARLALAVPLPVQATTPTAPAPLPIARLVLLEVVGRASALPVVPPAPPVDCLGRTRHGLSWGCRSVACAGGAGAHVRLVGVPRALDGRGPCERGRSSPWLCSCSCSAIVGVGTTPTGVLASSKQPTCMRGLPLLCPEPWKGM